MATSPLTGFPYLLTGDAPDLAGITWAMAQWADSGDVLLQATDEADRDAKYSDVPAPALCISKSRPAVWLKTGDTGTSADWKTVWSDSGWVTTGFTASPSFSVTLAQVRRVGLTVHFAALLTATTDFGPTNDSSNIHAGNLAGDPVLITLPSGFRPSAGSVPTMVSASFGSWGARILSSGAVSLLDGPPGAMLSNGDNLTIYQPFLSLP